MYLDKIALGNTDDQVQLTPTSFISGTLATNSSAEFAFSSLRSRKNGFNRYLLVEGVHKDGNNA